MRKLIVMTGFVLVTATAPGAAQEQSLVPASPSPTLRLDFGLKQAMKILPPGQMPPRVVHSLQHGTISVTPAEPVEAPAIDCAMVKKHTHTLLAPPPMRIIPPPTQPKHHLKVVTVPACPVR